MFDKVRTKFRRNVIYLNKLSSYCFKFRVIGRDHCAENVRVPIPPSLDPRRCVQLRDVYLSLHRRRGKNFINEGKIGSRVSTDRPRLRGREGERRVIGTETNEIGKLSFSVK